MGLGGSSTANVTVGAEHRSRFWCIVSQSRWIPRQMSKGQGKYPHAHVDGARLRTFGTRGLPVASWQPECQKLSRVWKELKETSAAPLDAQAHPVVQIDISKCGTVARIDISKCGTAARIDIFKCGTVANLSHR